MVKIYSECFDVEILDCSDVLASIGRNISHLSTWHSFSKFSGSFIGGHRMVWVPWV